MTADQMPDELWVSFIAKAMAYRNIGDPHAVDIKGEQRWTWYKKDAEKFLEHFGYLMEKSTRATPPKSQGVEVNYDADMWERELIKFVGTLSYTVWNICHNPTHADGNSDWFNDTLPHVVKGQEIIKGHIEKIREATRQHPTPAQAQGERGKALESFRWIKALAGDAINEPSFRTAFAHIEAALSHAPEVVTLTEIVDRSEPFFSGDTWEMQAAVEAITKAGYTIIKRTE